MPESKLKVAAFKAKNSLGEGISSYAFPVQPPKLLEGVVPKGVVAPVLAMDINQYDWAQQIYGTGGFPGFSYLAQLTTRSEYRAFASALSSELTRKFIRFTSSQDDGDDSSDKIKKIEQEFVKLGVRQVIQRIAELDCYFGRGQIFINIDGADNKTPLILDRRTVKKGSLRSITPIEPIWTTPSAYNAIDPTEPDFYKPSSWYMMGKEIHASRLCTVITRPLPDVLKPAFNFAGISLSQLAQPYVENWLRTRQSVADLINNFSITGLATSMDQVLQGSDDGSDLFARAELFTATRSNRGLMLLDKDREQLLQVNTPLTGLHELQAQSQEHMCSVSRIPSVILTGISPSGLNASSEGSIRMFYDWVSAQQEAYYRDPIDTILKVVQLHLFGEIDSDIGFSFVPLYQLTRKEEAEINELNSKVDSLYVIHGVLSPEEIRNRLAKDLDSGYMGLDVEDVPEIIPEPEQQSIETEQNKNKSSQAAEAGHSTAGVPRPINKELVGENG